MIYLKNLGASVAARALERLQWWSRAADGGGMRRRDFITGLYGSATLTFAAGAQERMRRVGIIIAGSENDPEAKRRLEVLLQSLNALGWTNGRNISFDFRWEPSDIERIRKHAAELVALQPDALVAVSSTPATIAFKAATSTIPIILST
jgi:ABC-type uncharacterized transport system substrate-binding protein